VKSRALTPKRAPRTVWEMVGQDGVLHRAAPNRWLWSRAGQRGRPRVFTTEEAMLAGYTLAVFKILSAIRDARGRKVREAA